MKTLLAILISLLLFTGCAVDTSPKEPEKVVEKRFEILSQEQLGGGFSSTSIVYIRDKVTNREYMVIKYAGEGVEALEVSN